MKKFLILLFSSAAFAGEYTVFYPQDMELVECDVRDKFQVVNTMQITCEGIQQNQPVVYSTEIEMIPAPYTLRYVKGGVQKGIMFDD